MTGADVELRVTRAGPTRIATPLFALLVTAVIGLGLVMRLWLVYHSPLTGDEAIVGLMADRIRSGQMFTFFWGQSYGGVEPYLVAAWSLVAGSGTVAVNIVPTLLSGLTAILVWRVGLKILPSGMGALAVAGGAATWVWPAAVIYNSTRELGFRGVTAAAGVGVLLLACRALESRSAVDFAFLGLLAGIGWWSSPEIVYFVLPAAVLLVSKWPQLVAVTIKRFLLATVAFVMGALPWLATNVGSHFASLRSSSSPSYVHATYGGRVSIFFHKTLPMMLGFRVPLTGGWVGHGTGHIFFAVTAVTVALVCGAAIAGVGTGQFSAEARALSVGAIGFPLIFAVFPATSFWIQGQYGVFFVPLVTLAVTSTVGGWIGGRAVSRHSARGRSAPRTSVLYGSALVGLTAVSLIGVASFNDGWIGGHSKTFFDGWHDPSAVAQQSARDLDKSGVRFAFADYWVANDLDYLSSNKLVVTDPYADRWVAEYDRVIRSPDRAWIFSSPAHPTQASAAFPASAPGPYGIEESAFTSKLEQLRIPFHVIHAGVLDAVIPATPVTPQELAIPPPYWR